MKILTVPVFVIAVSLAATSTAEQEVLFEDDFEQGLSERWQIVGLDEDDYRVKDGALELRVQPGRDVGEMPMLKVMLPFTSEDRVTASVDVRLVDKFTEPEELAGLFLLDQNGWELRATKQLMDGQLFFSPPSVQFLGKTGTEDDLSQYSYTYRPAAEKAGALRILVRQHYAYFQVGPSKDGKYLNFFHSAIGKNAKERGFAIAALGGPEEGEHWVRFDNFRVVRGR